MYGTSASRIVMQACVVITLGAFSAEAAPNNGAGPTQAQIDCHNRATNDYVDQTKECKRVLGDLPEDLRQCNQDAFDDMNRRQAACKAKTKIGGLTTFDRTILGGTEVMSRR
ncbi:hypothetical protein [Bauldia litoralis]|uniref:Cysteine rich repeat-containing protein n=1 Tax=Bauldia litoralis TaxID=665467 RepID=A0A1G6BIK7_9HYPH|nr:hypothetical protein [Bauldia litoralis]SDB20461.1 hypothetical protein SAMN02982931_01497 [Bauldia litoralis]